MNINEFRSAMKFGGARSNLFKVKITNPVNASADNIITFMCKGASIPQRIVNPINLSYHGRQIKVAGVTQNYEDWNVTIYSDEDYRIRNAMEEWQNAINSSEGNARKLNTSEPALYKSVAEVIPLSQKGDELRTYRFIGIWPTNVGETTLDWGQEEVQTFPVTFSIDYWVLDDNSASGNAGGSV